MKKFFKKLGTPAEKSVFNKTPTEMRKDYEKSVADYEATTKFAKVVVPIVASAAVIVLGTLIGISVSEN
jgi:hypothetical protein